MNTYEQMSAETKKAIDALVGTLPWEQIGEDDEDFLGDLQIHVVAQLEKVILNATDEFGFTVVGKTALEDIRENL